MGSIVITCVEDIDYIIHNALVLNKSEYEIKVDHEQMFRKVIEKYLDLKYTVLDQWMWRFHILRSLKKGSS